MTSDTPRSLFLYMMVVLLAAWVFCTPLGASDRGGSAVFDVITIDGAITPAVASYVVKSLEESQVSGSAGLIIALDTPGGLDTSMRDIVKSILNAPLPVIVYVSPSGARAASAGVMITMAAHVAAMAPGTNIGAAHPVAIGVGGKMDETMEKKVVSDAVAYTVGIAERRGRNAEWAEAAVRESVSITAEEAREKNVIDVVALNMEDLLRQIDGRDVELPPGMTTLATKGVVLNYKGMGLRDRILTTIANPNIAYLLLLIGLAGLYFEFSNPGAILPGVVGAISLLLAFFAMQTLPVNYAGILLIVLAVILFVAEIMVASYGMLSVAGVISLVFGSLLLFDSADPALRVSFKVMIPAIIVVSAFFITVIGMAVRAHRRKPATGMEGMMGATGRAETPVHRAGTVFVKSEHWNAVSVRRIEAGTPVRVIGMKGLVLEVEPLEQND
ncbi:MAG: nodulation protein NfeD [Syntrophales bacterium]|jgi:membrane-bound serine protease (ClpP class)|nr:nodulation protein NfeD [Syntrophales bacterium]MCK9527439.1 nodulation protein NfeD [Syntrophales bacterium]MDX9921543.1 nodulation protein NfeD [Syntrophales bacterium]